MESETRYCPICEKPTPTFKLSHEREGKLLAALGIDIKDSHVASAEGFWCLGCLTPYLCIWPEVEDTNDALRMAGFPPKGGRL